MDWPSPQPSPLQELIDRQLLTASDVSGFTGMQVTVTLSAESQNPQEILIRARLADGHEIVALADGSVHQLPSTRKTKGVVHR
ncbi:MAG TPA: hypothetical protein VN673_14140 [Clostridia bacterium]|nr:hypothetical protein [Clostridia bacterium]